MTSTKFFLLPIILILITSFSCKNRVGVSGGEINSISRSGDTIFVPAGSSAAMKLVLKTIEPSDYKLEYLTTGIIRPVPGQLAKVSSPFEGRITNSFVRLGEKVSKGSPVFSIFSSDYFEAVKDFRKAMREKEISDKILIRKKELFAQGIISVKELDEVTLNSEINEKEYDKAKATLLVFNVNPEEADFEHPLIIRAPISGEIVDNNITLGQYLKSDSDPVVTVANLDKIWVVAHVKEKDLGSIGLHDQVGIITENHGDKPFEGKVDYIGSIMEDQTRSVEVYINCVNVDKELKPGMFVNVRFYHDISEAIIIPSTSVFQDEESSFLYIQCSPGAYIKRKISVASVENQDLLVRSGLEKNDVIVSAGGLYLR